jgi:hypothetical protein
MDESVRAAALRYAAQHYPSADLVVVAGSSAQVRRPRSDIDLLVIGPRAMFREGLSEAAHTELFESELFEVFASTPDAFREHAYAGVARFRPVSSQMLLDGVVVLSTGRADDLLDWTRTLLSVGPRPSEADLAQRRYSVTSTLDDLLDAEDPLERVVLASTLFERLAEFLLLADGRWIGSGRWLLRRLMQWNEGYARELGSALVAGDVSALERLTIAGLAPHGGRLMAGHVRGEPR